jgi:3-isopropylmalate dehydrogenase
MTRTIAVLAGDGIGPEIMAPAVLLLRTLIEGGLDARLEEAPVGAAAWHLCGDPLPPETLALARRADAVLFGAVGDSRLDHLGPKRPDAAIGGLRQGLGLINSLRHVSIPQELAGISPLRAERVAGTDVLIVRELGGDVYFGHPRGQRAAPDGSFAGQDEGFDTMRYAQGEVRRVARVAFELARGRARRLVSADKANVLETSRLWRRVVTQVGAEYPDVQLSHLYADNVAMQLVTAPRSFDVILTGNLFGDILSDVATVLSGSIGLAGSAMFNEAGKGLYEPGHGSAWDIAGQDRANPIAQLRCVALLLRHSLGRPDLAQVVDDAIAEVLRSGLRTADIVPQVRLPDAPAHQDDVRLVGTSEMGGAVVAAVARSFSR